MNLLDAEERFGSIYDRIAAVVRFLRDDCGADPEIIAFSLEIAAIASTSPSSRSSA